MRRRRTLKLEEDLSAFKQLPKQSSFIKDENIDLNALNSYYQPRMQHLYTQQQQPLQCSNMLYHSPPGYPTVSKPYIDATFTAQIN